MPRPNPPPLTSKQAKRLHQQQGKKFTFAASQYRAAERREQLEERRKQAVAKEQKKKENKRKREEKQERDREKKRQQLAEGKISVEDTWGKVTASQPRLGGFFKKHITAPLLSNTGGDSSTTENKEKYTCVDCLSGVMEPPNRVSAGIPVQMTSQIGELSISDISIQSDNASVEQVNSEITQFNPQNPAPATQQCDPDQDLLDAQLSFTQSLWDFVIAEDETANTGTDADPYIRPPTPIHEHSSAKSTERVITDTIVVMSPLKRKADDSHHSSFCSPSKSMRSALSEMSPSKVNIRAQEKPDTTSTPKPGSALPSPDKEKGRSAETPADVLALIGPQDLEDDLEDLMDDKENQDPWLSKTSIKSCDRTDTKDQPYSKSETSQRVKQPPPTGFGAFEDCEDRFDFDFEEMDDFDDGGVEDSFLAAMSTQLPGNTVVTVHGSSNKPKAVMAPPLTPVPSNFNDMSSLSLSVPCNSLQSLPPVRQEQDKTGSQSAPTKPGRLSLPLTKSHSIGLDGIEDDDLTELAEKLEAETRSAAKPGPSRSNPRRKIPWLHLPAFNPPLQLQNTAADSEDTEEPLTPSPERGSD